MTNSESIIGGKASNLQLLSKEGFPVPRWMALDTKAALRFLSPEEKDLIDLKDELEESFGETYLKKSFAIRSSAQGEDGIKASFAGQFDTVLNVPAAEIPEAIQQVVKSRDKTELKEYLKLHDLKNKPEVAVIIQEMLHPQISGVAFGCDPISGSANTFTLTALWGLGEGIVSGELEADTWKLDAQSGAVQNTQIAIKDFRYDVHEKSGTIKIKVPEIEAEKPALDSSQLSELYKLICELNDYFGVPQDIEFSFENGKLFLLQSRPVTTAVENKQEGEYTLWDNSNIVESYPGITTPLTFSFIHKMYEFVYKQFVGLMGASEQNIEKRKEVFANTLGLVRGRVYYNLLSWYKMLAMLPGYSVNARFMENMMGVQEKFDLPDDWVMSKGRARLSVLKMLFKMVSKQIGLKKQRRAFTEHLNLVMAKYSDLDFDKMSSEEIIKSYREFEQSLLLQWKAPLVNDFFAMIWFGLLQKFTSKEIQDKPNIHNDLLCGSQDIISVQPIHRLMKITDMVRESESARVYFEKMDSKVIWNNLSGEFPQIEKEVKGYLADFGERCVGELKLESISYSQEPERLIRVIQQYLEYDVISKHGKGLEDQIREEAEAEMKSALKGKPLKKWWFRILVNRTRDLVSARENLRYERTRGFGMVRKMMVALGKRWEKEQKLFHSRDIFYLQLEEVLDGFKIDYPQLIEHRKNEFEDFRSQKPPKERFFTYGDTFSDTYIYSDEKIEITTGDLQGIGCCPGIVEGKVKIVLDPSELESLDNDILITVSTDPGWVTLFPTCSAILVERGSLLSHSAIVSREMGIPCIVGVKGLLQRLKTGDRIQMDGSTGQIKLMENE